jgi:ABC-2 type transport system ATP-binding protein
MLALSSIDRRFGERVVLNNVTFSIGDGEVVGFVGLNGAGKTTTMRIAMGLLEPNAGTVLWDGKPITESVRQSIGYMPEERGLYPKMRIGEQLQYLAELAGKSRKDAKRESLELLERFGLLERAKEPVEKLSLGNQQRVQLAVALTGNPRMLILDEPFSGLDPSGVDALSELLEERIADGVGMLFSSHQLELVERLADRIVMIHEGHIALNERIDRSVGTNHDATSTEGVGQSTQATSLAQRFREITGANEVRPRSSFRTMRDGR